MRGTLYVTGDAEVDHLLNTDAFALLLGMLLDQQVPMEWAFGAPYRLRERLGGKLDAETLASTDPDEVVALFKGPPALHRFPGSMGKRAQELSRHIVEHYGGDTEAIWRDVDTGSEVLRRLLALPGFGEDKARIFLALLAKRMGVRPKGWEEAAGPFADGTRRSVADIDSPERVAEVRAWKKEQKARAKAKGTS
jgi:uncharacterized HhH-GPD family protein